MSTITDSVSEPTLVAASACVTVTTRVVSVVHDTVRVQAPELLHEAVPALDPLTWTVTGARSPPVAGAPQVPPIWVTLAAFV